jgi:hypothetical protein
MSGIIAALIGLFCTTVSSIVTFVLTKRKYNVDVDSQQIKNTNESFDVYKKMMTETFQMQDRKIEMLQKENDYLRQQVSQLQLQVISLASKLGLGKTSGSLEDKGVPPTEK